MEIAIYQISPDRDINHLMFMSLDWTMDKQVTGKIDSSIYDKIFSGDVDCDNLEEVYRMFNADIPDDYIGRSLSMSDIVETIDDNGNSTFYFCDTIGFKTITFDPSVAKDLTGKITVVLCEPRKEAVIAKISNTLRGMQNIVKGSIEAFYPFQEGICIVCNEEGKLNGMRPNRAIHDDDGELVDIIFGPFFICRCDGSEFASLTTDQCIRYARKFQHPNITA